MGKWAAAGWAGRWVGVEAPTLSPTMLKERGTLVAARFASRGAQTTSPSKLERGTLRRWDARPPVAAG